MRFDEDSEDFRKLRSEYGLYKIGRQNDGNRSKTAMKIAAGGKVVDVDGKY